MVPSLQAGSARLTPYKKSDIGTGYSAEVLVSVPVMYRGGVKALSAALGGVAAGLKYISISASERGKRRLDLEALEREKYMGLRARLINRWPFSPGARDHPQHPFEEIRTVTLRICKLRRSRIAGNLVPSWQ